MFIKGSYHSSSTSSWLRQAPSEGTNTFSVFLRSQGTCCHVSVRSWINIVKYCFGRADVQTTLTPSNKLSPPPRGKSLSLQQNVIISECASNVPPEAKDNISLPLLKALSQNHVWAHTALVFELHLQKNTKCQQVVNTFIS